MGTPRAWGGASGGELLSRGSSGTHREGRGWGGKCHCIFGEKTDEVILQRKSRLSVA